MPGIRTTPVVRALLIICISAFLIQLVGDRFLGTHLLETFSLVPHDVIVHFHLWQLVTYMFMHADLLHILFNMLILWMIGSELEAVWGARFFLKYYFICGLSAGLFYLAIQIVFFRGTQAEFIPMLGSSGAIYGLLVAYGIIFSDRVLLFMMLFPMKAKNFVIVLAAIEFISTVFYSNSGIASAAHLGGMIVGFAYLFTKAWWRVRSKQGPKKKKTRRLGKHLRLVVNNEVLKDFDDDTDEEDSGPGTTYH